MNIETVLIANRGEIAVRIIKTLRRMGIGSVAVYSDADATALHVQLADVAIRIGRAAAIDSYLSIDAITRAAKKTNAQAVHPGYGFLSENAEFAAACVDAGLIFIGPPAAAIAAMGDKIRAKQLVAAAGVPVVPGRAELGMTDEELVDAATEIGFPVLLKPSAGGGGKGMHIVERIGDLTGTVAAARREAMAAFGNGSLLVERFVPRSRHIEIQVLADNYGNVVHLGERECSLQRRHQKIVEEAPSPLLDETMRQRLGQAAIDAARAVDYSGVGTVEFIVDDQSTDRAYFIEMNTRLQVEHAVTELITGFDLVEQQIRVAAGERLAFNQSDIRFSGHAIEARIYAENPARGFLPSGGTVLALYEPTDLVRVDSALFPNASVTVDYDPMLAKLIAHGSDRATALHCLRAALHKMTVLGMPTNIEFLNQLLADQDVAAGNLDTELIERKLPELLVADVPDEVFVAAAMERALCLEPTNQVDPWDTPGGWRLGEHSWLTSIFSSGNRESVEVKVCGRADQAQVSVNANEPRVVSANWERHSYGDLLTIAYADRVTHYRCARSGAVLWLAAEGRFWAVTTAVRHSSANRASAMSVGGPVTSPMPGTVLSVKVRTGEHVSAGQPLLIVEAMKMEHTITAPIDGIVVELRVQAGQQVALDERLAQVKEVSP